MVWVKFAASPVPIDVEYRPPRISMFPPSYAERAALRQLKRQGLRQIKQKPSSIPLVEEKKENNKETKTQTQITYCYHNCPAHPEASAPVGDYSKKGKDKGKEMGSKDDERGSKKDKSKGAKEKHVEFEEQNSSSSEDEDTGKKSKTKGKGKGESTKGGKSKSDKGDKGDKGDKTEREDKSKKADKPAPATSVLPYPWSAPILDKIYQGGNLAALGNKRPSKDDDRGQPGANDTMYEQMVESPRRHDEEYVACWLNHEWVRNQEDAVKWLGDRDTNRFKKIAHLTHDISCKDRNLHSCLQCYPPGGYHHARHVSLGAQPLSTPPCSPQHGTCHVKLPAHVSKPKDAVSDSSSSTDKAGPGKPLIAHLDENNNLCLADGTRIITPPIQGFAHPNTYPGLSRPPLQPMADNAQAVHAQTYQYLPAAPAHTWQHQPAVPMQAYPCQQAAPPQTCQYQPVAPLQTYQQQPAAPPQTYQYQPAAPGQPYLQQPANPAPNMPSQQPAMQQTSANFNQPNKDHGYRPGAWTRALAQDQPQGFKGDKDPQWDGTDSPRQGSQQGSCRGDNQFNRGGNENPRWSNNNNTSRNRKWTNTNNNQDTWGQQNNVNGTHAPVID
ncbi:MAG: hypothetical protein LQ340_005072 [Diploschistes diacapsis]|nr:MAG: hypothetical protein LQ340_005072 [Diploschistes diacapsis]